MNKKEHEHRWESTDRASHSWIGAWGKGMGGNVVFGSMCLQYVRWQSCLFGNVDFGNMVLGNLCACNLVVQQSVLGDAVNGALETM